MITTNQTMTDNQLLVGNTCILANDVRVIFNVAPQVNSVSDCVKTATQDQDKADHIYDCLAIF